MDPNDLKHRQMEEEMKRFETEISSQPSTTSYPTATYQYSQPGTYPNPYVPGSQFASPSLMGTNPYFTNANGIYMSPSYAMPPNYMVPPQVATTISAAPIIQAQPSVISAPPQVAAPSQLAAAVKANKEAEAAAKLATADDNIEVDDDVTRALLAAAAGVTYNHSTTMATSASSITTITDTNSTSTATTSTAAPKVVPSVPAKTVIVPQSLLPTQLASSSRLSSIDQAKCRSKSSYTEELYPFQKKVYKRIAAGMVWEDPTLADWDPNDFRIFCGDLGNEVNDDTLIRAFSRYPSFRKAKVIIDKRTGKSRGYGFVSFSDPNDFTRAMREMNGKYVGNRPIKLKKSDWKSRQLETFKKKEKEKRKLGLRI
nr:RNA binding protein 42 [Hymenolepis microstoma]